jgi:hypothetical protein
MIFLNEYEIADAVNRYGDLNGSTPNLAAAVQTLANLVDWTNFNSDGWPYWAAPRKATQKLQALIQSVDRFDPEDVTVAEVRKALSPVKAFRTRYVADFVVVEVVPV